MPRQPKLPPISEEEFQSQVLDLAKLLGWRRAHFRRVRVQRKDGSCYYETPVQADGKGFLDLVLLRGCRIVVIELKTAKGTTTPEQEEWLAAWRLTPAEVHVFRPSDFDTIQRILS